MEYLAAGCSSGCWRRGTASVQTRAYARATEAQSTGARSYWINAQGVPGREADLPSGLIEALSEWKMRSPATNPGLAALGIEPISARVTPHSLRRTYASIRAAAGDHPGIDETASRNPHHQAIINTEPL